MARTQYRSRYRNERLKRTVKRMDKEEIRKTTGRWYGVYNAKEFTVAAAVHGTAMQLPEPPGSGSADDDAKVTIYGMDTLITMSQFGGNYDYSGDFVYGNLLIAKNQKGTSNVNFANAGYGSPTGIDQNALARPRVQIPFALSRFPGTDRNQVVIPYRFFRGNEITIRPGENLWFIMAMQANVVNNGEKYKIAIFGRYRYVIGTGAGLT